MFTDASKDTEAAVGRARIARQKVRGSAEWKILVTDEHGNNIVDVPISAVPARSIRFLSWFSRFSSNFGSQSPHIVDWLMVAVAIVVLAVTTVLVTNRGTYQTASAPMKSAVVADPNRQPSPRQLVVQKAVNQPTTLAAVAPVVNTHAATQAVAPRQPPPLQPPPPPGQVPGFGGSNPFVQTKFFIVPPPGETRYVPNEIVLQVGSHISRETLEAVAASLALTILDIQNLRALGTTTIRISTNNISVAEAIRLLAKQRGSVYNGTVISRSPVISANRRSGFPGASHQRRPYS
jgi:hypothetical protein